VIGRILILAFLLLLVGKIFFPPQLAALKRWFDGAVNAMLLAIALVYLVHIAMWLLS
jgi:hypothetical protein